ncbi:hypothetical protein [Chitinophaga varians]|uniref:hypothetical protein n=1 Tax=Chitinophaga varians TaxID=2202339 RepID=UPI00165FB9E2|nr:hypothetical protein [Chitinophaga varians]MBC9911630.1 hypothetical protein [Chitinophaga varians]
MRISTEVPPGSANPYQQATVAVYRDKYGPRSFPFIQLPIAYKAGNEDIYLSLQ